MLYIFVCICFFFLIGNLKEACKLLLKYNLGFQIYYEKFINYTRPTTQNIFIDICSNYGHDYVIDKVKSAHIYFIIYDETR